MQRENDPSIAPIPRVSPDKYLVISMSRIQLGLPLDPSLRKDSPHIEHRVSPLLESQLEVLTTNYCCRATQDGSDDVAGFLAVQF